MEKFKKGDIVRCVRPISSTNYLVLGKNYTVEAFLSSIDMVVVQGLPYQWNACRFELVKREFCIKTDPWFIRINNEEEFNVAKQFLNNKGLAFSPRGGSLCYNKSFKYLCLYEVGSTFTQTNVVVFGDNGEKEIKLTFKNTIELDKIEYPEVELPKSERQVEIKKIEEEMRKLADRLNKLKGD